MLSRRYACSLRIQTLALRRVATKARLVLGIESSCDDTGCAIVDEHGNILGEALNSQTKFHVEMGGIQPPLAYELHKQNIDGVVKSALANASVDVKDVSAIATTVKPGMRLSLLVGIRYSQQLLQASGKPFIPIHHMEAHALTARLTNRVEFPYLCLLISGGHCLLAVVQGVDEFVLIGSSIDIAPGDALDKVARRLKLNNLPECAGKSGGHAIETLALKGSYSAFEPVYVMNKLPDCNFSFSGIQNTWERRIIEEEARIGLKGGDVLPNAADICAGMQYNILLHLARRVQRGFLYCHAKGWMSHSSNHTLVVSGGVASNTYLRSGLERLCDNYGYKLVCPPQRLCTDNGVMIAWNGMERLVCGKGIVDKPNPSEISAETKCPLGVDMTADVVSQHIVQLTSLSKILH